MKSSALPRRVTSKNPVVILRHVIKAIKAEPKRYDQSEIIARKRDRFNDASLDDFPSCGTIACVGGWVNILTGARQPGDLDRAAAKLGLEWNEQCQLFSAFPKHVRRRRRGTAQQHASDGIKHIKRFVLKKWGQKL